MREVMSMGDCNHDLVLKKMKKLKNCLKAIAYFSL